MGVLPNSINADESVYHQGRRTRSLGKVPTGDKAELFSPHSGDLVATSRQTTSTRKHIHHCTVDTRRSCSSHPFPRIKTVHVHRVAVMPDEREKTTVTPSHPPPPCDPFQRYQTPWPRQGQDDENPFIRFRRFADEQVKSFFSGVPFVKRSLDDHFEDLTAQHRRYVDNALKEMMDNQHQLVRDMAEFRSRQKDEDRSSRQLNPDQPRTSVPAGSTASNDPATELDMYERPHVDGLDPFGSREDTHNWLVSSQYSPLWLNLPVKPHPEHPPSSLWDRFGTVVRLNTNVENRLTTFAWQSAFEDLLVLERTGELPKEGPSSERREHPGVWLARLLQKDLMTPPKEESDQRTVLASFWGPLLAQTRHGELYRHRPDLMQEHRDVEDQRDDDRQRAGTSDDEDYIDPYDDDDGDDDDDEVIDAGREPPPATELQGKPLARTLAHAFDAVGKTIEGLMDSAQPTFDSHSAASRSREDQDFKASIVSTMTQVHTRTLPDGSVETRRVLRRSFSDGNEEHEETIETSPPRLQAPSNPKPQTAINSAKVTNRQTQTDQPQREDQGMGVAGGPEERSRGGGWFWR